MGFEFGAATTSRAGVTYHLFIRISFQHPYAPSYRYSEQVPTKTIDIRPP